MKIEIAPLSEKRWNHCKSVAEYSMKLANHWGANPTKAYLSGLLHDISRELPKDAFIPLAKEYGIKVTKEEEAAPILLHGAISGLIAKINYHIDDDDILSAMEKHTVGNETMSTLDKIIFLADEIEPLRSYEGVEELRAMAFVDLNKALNMALTQSQAYLKDRGIAPHPNTEKMKNHLLKEI